MGSNHVHINDYQFSNGHHGHNAPNSHNSPYINDQDPLAGYNLFQNGHDSSSFGQNYHLDPTHLSTTRPQLQRPASVQQQQHQQWQQPSNTASAVNPTYEQHAHIYRSYSNSPVSFQNGMPQNGFGQQSVAATTAASQDRTGFAMSMPPYSGVAQSSTVSPAALQGRHTYATNPAVSNQYPRASNAQGGAQPYLYPTVQTTQQPVAPLPSIEFAKPPPGKWAGHFSIIDYNQLTEATKSKKFAEFVNIGEATQELPINKTTIPQYLARKSRKELKALAAADKQLLARITKRSTKRGDDLRSRVRISQKYGPLSKSTSPGASVELSSETDSSDYSSGYDSSDSEEETSPLPASRPSAPLDATRYDTIKAVWLSRQSSAQAEKIRTALTEFWEVVRTIKDRWKADGQAVKEAEEKKKLKEIPFLKDRVQTQRDMLEVALKTAIEHGHPDVIRLLSENIPFLFLLYSFMAERVSEKDYGSSLGSVTLDMLMTISTLTTETLEKAKLMKVLQLFGKRGDDKIQAKVKRILENAASASKAKAKNAPSAAEQAVGSPAKEAKVKPEAAVRTPADTLIGAKRPRADGDGGQPAKRVISGTPTVPSASPKTTLKRPTATATMQNSATSAASSAAQKAKIVGKPTANAFFGLQSASKKPSAAAATAKAKPSSISEKKPAAKAFSFSDTMASLLKPKKEEPTVKAEDKRPAETAQERAKRLRKEERRKLRVTFKPDASLCDIRLFQHDPDEELGHDASMVRDVGDVGGEGRMFKQHRDMDMEEDDEYVPEQIYGEWKEPSLIDFSTIDLQTREANCAPYGGGLRQSESAERKVQELYVANTLVAYYHNPSEIPPSPREPSDSPVDGTAKPAVQFGLPDLTLSRLATFQPQAALQQPAAQTPQAGAAPDISAILNALKATNQNPQATSPASIAPSTNSAAPADALSQLLSGVSQSSNATPFGLPNAATPPIASQAPQVAATPDLSQLLSQLGGAQQTQTQPQPSPPVSFPFGFPPAVNPSQGFGNEAQAQALLAALISQNQQGAQAYGMPQMQPSADVPMGNYDVNENKRKRHNDSEQGGSSHGKKRQWDPNNPPKFTKPCMFFKEGKCRKGDECTFRHDI